MDWELVIEDLHSQLDAAERDRITAEAVELLDGEFAQVRLADRLRARRGEDVVVRLLDGTELRGRLADVAVQWFLLAEGTARVLVPVDAVAVAWPLAAAATPPGTVESRLRITHALRGLARHGGDVVVLTTAGALTGRLGRVGDDHVDVRLSGGQVRAVALRALLAVRTA